MIAKRVGPGRLDRNLLQKLAEAVRETQKAWLELGEWERKCTAAKEEVGEVEEELEHER